MLQPFLLGRMVRLHPLGVILAVARGVLIAGIAGALIAVPVVASVNAVATHLAGPRRERRRGQRGHHRRGGAGSRRVRRSVVTSWVPTAEEIAEARELLARGRRPHAAGGVALAVQDRRGAGATSRPRTSSAPGPSRSAAPTPACPGSRPRSAQAGVVAASAGNHAQGVALAASAARHPRGRLHAARGADPQGQRDPRLRRRGAVRGRDRRRGAAGGARLVRRGVRRGAGPPLRPPRHRRWGRPPAAPRSSSSAPRCAPSWCRPAAVACSPASRPRSSRAGPTSASSGCRPRAPRPTRRRCARGSRSSLESMSHDGRRHRHRAAR